MRRWIVIVALAWAACAPAPPDLGPGAAAPRAASPSGEPIPVVLGPGRAEGEAALRFSFGALHLYDLDLGPGSRWPALRVGDGPLGALDLEGVGEGDPTEPGASGWFWALAAPMSEPGAVLGVLQWVVGGPGPELVVVATSDGGRSWHRLATLPKPHYLAWPTALAPLGGPRFALTVALEDCADCGVAPGDTRYLSEDGGRTWRLERAPR